MLGLGPFPEKTQTLSTPSCGLLSLVLHKGTFAVAGAFTVQGVQLLNM